MNLLCRANLTLCAAICQFFIEYVGSEKRLLGMPMSLSVLTREKNWINQRSSLHKARGLSRYFKGGFARIATVELQELARSRIVPVPERDCVVQKSEVAKL